MLKEPRFNLENSDSVINKWVSEAVKQKCLEVGRSTSLSGDNLEHLLSELTPKIPFSSAQTDPTVYLSQNNILTRFRKINSCVMTHKETRVMYLQIEEDKITVAEHEAIGLIYCVPTATRGLNMIIFEDSAKYDSSIDLFKFITYVIEVSFRF